MFNTLIIFMVFAITVKDSYGYYPGLRKRPPLTLEETSDILAHLIEAQARRRFQQQLAQQQQYYKYQQQQQNNHGPNSDLDEELDNYPAPDFTYSFPDNPAAEVNGDIPFAVNPTDPRFYEGRPSSSISSTKNFNTYSYENDMKMDKDESGDIYNKPNIPIEPKPIISPVSKQANKILPAPFRGREDIAKLVQRLQQEGKASTVLNGANESFGLNTNPVVKTITKSEEAVVREHLGMGENIYMVALLAGITSAILVGVFALALAWIALQKRSKAAADVEYPAYGVTGPNKDYSPSGDRRLAQSAQMYHYQHQKQQIIAMENRQNEQNSGALTDVESDDDNEEGDYTVYECPGLAPTDEMEVKNPLFADDTPSIQPEDATQNSAIKHESQKPQLKSMETKLQQPPAIKQQLKSPVKPKQPPPTPQRNKPPRHSVNQQKKDDKKKDNK